MASNVIHRHECNDGTVLVVQRVKRSYVCFRVGVELLDPPERLAEGRLAKCRDAFLSAVADDILEGEY